ncbi:MAG TPA: hypothetical protein VKE22_24260 [Haliangiales bacterium]|nr:hypothetical protein [Haliangiales bacterium]
MPSPKAQKPRSVWGRAFFNQVNLILLGGAALFALTTFSWIPLLVGAGAEVLWLVLGADSSVFRRWVAVQEGKEKQRETERKAAEAIAALSPGYLERFRQLEEIAEEIRKLAGDNPSLETQLVQTEMDKLSRLLHTFLHMAVVHQRLSQYLEEGYETEIQRDIDRCEQALARERDPEVLSTLRQSQSLAEKRLKQHAAIEASYKVVSVKMETLEKSFRYLKSHVIAISSQEELTQEIDELITGVEAVEDLGTETEGILHDIGRARAAQAARQGNKV